MDLMYWALVGAGIVVTLALMVFGIAVSTHISRTPAQKAGYVSVFVVLGLGGSGLWFAHAMRNQITVAPRTVATQAEQDAATNSPPARTRPRRQAGAPETVNPESSPPTPAAPAAAVSGAPGQFRFTTQPLASAAGGPFTLQVIVLTDVAVNAPSLRIECDGPIDDAKFSVAGGPPMTSVRTMRTGNSVFLSFGAPTFLPETPVVLTLTSLSKVAVLRVIQQQF